MSCPWIDNRKKKEVEKTTKYAPLRLELKQQFPTYTVKQFNIIIDVLGGWSREVDLAMRELLVWLAFCMASISIYCHNTLYLKRVARNSYKTSKLVALYLKLQQIDIYAYLCLRFHTSFSRLLVLFLSRQVLL